MKCYSDVKDPDKFKSISSMDSHASADSPLVVACHDAFIEYNEGILLVKGNTLSCNDCFGPIGGEIKKGLHIEGSLRELIRDNVNLEVECFNPLGVSRVLFEEKSSGENSIADTIRFAYFGRGSGELRLNSKYYTDYAIILPKNYNNNLRASLHPYIKDIMDFAIRLVKG